MTSTIGSFNKYIFETYSGRELLKNHNLDEVGVWEIRGEDPNCDLHGSHYQPNLGIVRGKLRDVIMYGVSLPQFWQWGAGGDFKFIGESIPEIDDNSWKERDALTKEEARLEAELKAVRTRLKPLK